MKYLVLTILMSLSIYSCPDLSGTYKVQNRSLNCFGDYDDPTPYEPKGINILGAVVAPNSTFEIIQSSCYQLTVRGAINNGKDFIILQDNGFSKLSSNKNQIRVLDEYRRFYLKVEDGNFLFSEQRIRLRGLISLEKMTCKFESVK